MSLAREFDARPGVETKHNSADPPAPLPSSPYLDSLFHQHWWLNAVSNGAFEEAQVTAGTEVVGRLPFVVTRKLGFTQLCMPPYTHVLGPIVTPGSGKFQTQLLRRLSIIRELLERLPKYDFFDQTLPEAGVDALAFQEQGFQANLQYTFEIDCRSEIDALWAAMHFKTRQHIRRAEEKFSVNAMNDAERFVWFYNHNLDKRRRTSYFNVNSFPRLFEECQKRSCGEVLSAESANGDTAAMIFIVWDKCKMYYLGSSHARLEGDNGSVNLLLWSAMLRAHTRRLCLDLDGVTTSGTARFLSGFGGVPKLRTVVRRSTFLFGLLRSCRTQRYTSSFV